MNNKAVLWIRVSSESQSHGYSPGSQERLLNKAAEKYDVAETFNVTESAKTSEARRRFKEMVEYVKGNKVRHLFAWSHDRLGRHYKDFATLQSLIDDHDVSIHLVESNKEINQRSPISDRFLFQILAAIAEADNRKRAADTKRGMEQKASQGGVPHLAPIGYKNDVDPTDTNPDPAQRRRIVIQDEERAPLVTWAFETYAKGGVSYNTLVQELNRRGLTTKPSPKKSPGPITISFLQKVFENSFYYGEFPSGGKLWKGAYEPLITRELWDRVQARRRENKTHSRPAAKKWFAFKPFLKCGYCPCSIGADDPPGRHGKGRYVYYFCTSSKTRKDPQYYQKKYGTDKCPQRYWKEKEINDLIEAEIGKLYVNDFIAEKVRERLKRTHIKEEAAEKKELQRLQSEFTRKTNHLKLCYQDRLDGKISLEQYEEVQAGVQTDLNRIGVDLDRLGRHNIKYKEQGSLIIELLRGVKAVYSKADLKGKEKFLEVLLDKVILKEEPVFLWQPPFDTLFTLGEVFREKGIWGE